MRAQHEGTQEWQLGGYSAFPPIPWCSVVDIVSICPIHNRPDVITSWVYDIGLTKASKIKRLKVYIQTVVRHNKSMHQSESDEEELLLLLLLLEKPFNLNLGFLCFTFTPKGPTLICTNNRKQIQTASNCT